MPFNQARTLAVMEQFRNDDGTFFAAPGEDYHFVWLRDTLYAAYAYKYLGAWEKVLQAIWTIADLFLSQRQRLIARITSPVDLPDTTLHAKYVHDGHNEFKEITSLWGHHQLDMIGLFLYIVADLDYHNRRPIRNEKDIELLELLIAYLRSVEYWHRPDFGMWEECLIRHSSSIGAVVGGLNYLRLQRLVDGLRDPIIEHGLSTLNEFYPYESRDQCQNCVRERHVEEESHDCDAALLALIWPYHVVVNPTKIRDLLSRITVGHQTEKGKYHGLIQPHGFNRYWGDNYMRSDKEDSWISAEWPMFFFWLSIIYSQLNDHNTALEWFKKGMNEMVDDRVPEAYRNQKPNIHTPLVWGTALSLIAYQKLPKEYQEEISQ